MAPPSVKNPPCPSCESFNNLEGDAAALADLDRAAGETRAGAVPARDPPAAPARSAEAPTQSASAARGGEPRDSSAADARAETSTRLPAQVSSADSRADDRSSFVPSGARPDLSRTALATASTAQRFSSAARDLAASRAPSEGAAFNPMRDASPRPAASARETFQARGVARESAGEFSPVRPGNAAEASVGTYRGSFSSLVGEKIGGNPWAAALRPSADFAALATAIQSGDSVKLPQALQGIVNALRGVSGLSMPLGALLQGIQGLAVGAWISALSPGQRQSLQQWMSAQGPLRPELAAPLRAMPSIALFPALAQTVPGWTQRLEASVLKFASLLNADYLAKKSGKEVSVEEALRDKLGLFARRKLTRKGDAKKLKELLRSLLRRVQKKQDAQWEARKEDSGTDSGSGFESDGPRR